jgi:predicted short-subunit dehydrogenase-like oxidoreductase (DUF2520 family)
MEALRQVGWQVLEPVGRDGDPVAAAAGVDLLVVATPDAAIASVAARVQPVAGTVVAHLAGSLGLDVLAGHPRRGALHPLVALPSAEVGAERLRSGALFSVAGDALVQQAVDDLGGRSFEVADEDRAAYHAAACIASNHLVALLGQVVRVAGSVGVPMQAYLDLVRATVDNVEALGPRAALTGPAARGDWATIDRHRSALAGLGPMGADEVALYEVMVGAARQLVEDGADDASGRGARPDHVPDQPQP